MLERDRLIKYIFCGMYFYFVFNLFLGLIMFIYEEKVKFLKKHHTNN